MSVHIESKASDIAPVVLMPGDPKRCEYVAKKYLTNARLVNNVRGMTAYTGLYKGKMVTVFPSGMGCPSMGIYSYELFKEYNVQSIIRIGTMGSYTPLNLKDIVLVTTSITNSNYGKYLCKYENNYMEADSYLNDVIIACAKDAKINITKGNIYSSDVFYEQNNDFKEKVKKYSVLGVEMESFALFVNAKFLGKKAATLLMVSDSFLFDDMLSSQEREEGLDNLILLALESCLKIGN